MIEEGILGECLRCSSSLSGLRISPLTLKYVLPRTTLLHSWTLQAATETRKPRKRKCGDKTPNHRSCKSIVSHRDLKPTKAETELRRLLRCYPMLSNSCQRLLWSRFFSHSKIHGRPPANIARVSWEGNDPEIFVSDVHELTKGRSRAGGRD